MTRFLPLALLVAACVGAAQPEVATPLRVPVPVPVPVSVPVPVVTAPAPSSTDSPGAAAVAVPARRFAESVVPRDRTRARVLLYHTFGWVTPRPGVSPTRLREQLEWMRRNHVEIVRSSDLVQFLEGQLELPEQVAVITIDDGERNGYTRAFPILRELAAPFTLALATEAIELWQSRGTMQWSQIREMFDSGLCEVASHSHTHRRMTALPNRAVAHELDESRRLIEEHAGVRPEVFVFPLGAHDARVRELTRAAGYRAAFATSGAPVGASTNRWRVPRYEVTGKTSLWTFQRFFSHGD